MMTTLILLVMSSMTHMQHSRLKYTFVLYCQFLGLFIVVHIVACLHYLVLLMLLLYKTAYHRSFTRMQYFPD